MDKNERLTLVHYHGSEVIIEEPEKKVIKGFEIISYDNMVEWSDYKSEIEIPDVSENHWRRSELAPLQNQLRIVKVYFPFNFLLGENIWFIYQPWNSAINGWTSCPDVGYH